MYEEEVEEIGLSDPQFDFLVSTKKHTGFVAGFGSGKSFIGTLKSLNKIINQGIPKTAYYLPTYGDIKDIAFETFPEVSTLLGYDYKLNKSDKTFTLFDESGNTIGTTIFRNLGEPETIIGYEVGYSLLDETDILKQQIMDKAFKKILGRNRLVVPIEDEEVLGEIELGNIPEDAYFHNKKESWCWINAIDVAGTPEGFKWFYSRFVKKYREETDLLIRASTYSNMDNLPEDFIDTLKEEYPPELFDAYVSGQFVNLTSGSIYRHFNRKTHHSDVTDNGYEPIEIGQDFNVGGCVSIVYIERDGKDIAIDEFESYDTREVIENIKRKYQNRVIRIYPDASGNSRKTNASQTDIQMLRQAGFQVFVNNRNPNVTDRHNIANNRMYKKLMLVNTEKCPKYTEALEQHSFNDKGDPEKFNSAGTVDDYTDAGTYLLAYKHPITGTSTRVRISGL